MLDHYFIYGFELFNTKINQQANIVFSFYYFTAPQNQYEIAWQGGGVFHSSRHVAVDVLLEVVCHPADRLDVGVLGLPLHVGAVVPSLDHVHAAAVVGLLVQHPAVITNKFNIKDL